ncbi:MAG: flavin reductase family protein [Spirochaetaceae bacterium]|nr:flavin reductase family protein [Spirochaetaceae bacterium]
MSKVLWKPGTMVYPVPAVMVSCGNQTDGYNIITIAWTGTICTDPAMAYISVRPDRYSYDIIKKNGDFVINLTTKDLARATDWCGVKSGRDYDKFKEMNLTPIAATKVRSPLIEECPLNIECKVTEIKELGSHHMFLAEVVAVNASKEYLDETTQSFNMEKAGLISYIHGKYYGTSSPVGKFGYSIQKKKKERWKKKMRDETRSLEQDKGHKTFHRKSDKKKGNFRK